jgi:hypothetical protein
LGVGIGGFYRNKGPAVLGIPCVAFAVDALGKGLPVNLVGDKNFAVLADIPSFVNLCQPVRALKSGNLDIVKLDTQREKYFLYLYARIGLFYGVAYRSVINGGKLLLGYAIKGKKLFYGKAAELFAEGGNLYLLLLVKLAVFLVVFEV